MTRAPPLVPSTSPFTRCYCEENVYLLCQTFTSDPVISKIWKTFVIFISNEHKIVALYSQKSSPRPDIPVVWDYHVILLLRPRLQNERRTMEDDFVDGYGFVYDFDTTLTVPSPWEDYLASTFLYVPEHYESDFRVIPGESFLKQFASDRSHMLIKSRDAIWAALLDGSPSQDRPAYRSPPPLYPPIQGSAAVEAGITHNLMSHYVDMSDTHQIQDDGPGAYGRVFSRDEIDNFTL